MTTVGSATPLFRGTRPTTDKLYQKLYETATSPISFKFTGKSEDLSVFMALAKLHFDNCGWRQTGRIFQVTKNGTEMDLAEHYAELTLEEVVAARTARRATTNVNQSRDSDDSTWSYQYLVNSISE